MVHRKTVRHFHEIGHLHELTFSCYRRMPLLTNDAWRERLARCLDAAGRESAIRLAGFVFMPEHDLCSPTSITAEHFGHFTRLPASPSGA